MYSEINNLYNFNTVEYDGLSIPFDMAWKNVSIASSGGADSTLLLYIISDIITKNNLECEVHVISNIRCWKTRPWQEHISDLVFENIKLSFKHIRYTRHTNFVPPALEHGSGEPNIVDEYGKVQSGDTIELQSFAEYIGHKHRIDAYFNAVTRNPPVAISGSLPRRDVDATDSNVGLMFKKHKSMYVCHPFRFVPKDWVIRQYFDKNLSDLLNITRSCEGEFSNITYETYIPGQYVPLCHNCFWCKERSWAINELIQKQQQNQSI